jgi:hypothetical protein
MLTLLKRLASFIFDDGRGQIAAAVAGVLALVTAYTLDQRSIGARDAVHVIDAQGQQLAKKARIERDAVRPADAVDSMRKHWCSDC